MFSAAIKSGAAGNPTDPQFKYVTMLLHGDGTNGAQNNTFLDSSTNNFVITRNGNTTQGTFTPYGSNWSNYFNGSSDYLTVASNAAFQFSTGDFTIELWYYMSSLTGGNQHLVDMRGASSTALAPLLYVTSGGVLYYYTAGTNQITGATLSVGQWYHIALARSGTSTKLFVNGAQSGSTLSDSTNYIQSSVYIGRASDAAGGYVNGYESNVRIVKGTAVYTAAFTPSTTPLTAITNTSLLTCQSNRFIDNSSNTFTVTSNGSPSVQRFSPFSPTTAYSTSVIGGSGYFDGSGDWLETSLLATTFGSSNFTIECWLYYQGDGRIYANYRSDPGNVNGTELLMIGTDIYFPLYQANTNPGLLLQVAHGMALNTWNHIAVTRSSSTFTIWINGVSKTTGSYASALNSPDATVTYIGRRNWQGNANYLTGYISNFRTVIGTALYSSTFTPPTAPLTAVTNTAFLMSTTNAGILDNAMMNDLETVGNAQISTSVKKYGTGSMYFDGTGDYLRGANSPLFAFGTGNFTVEMWVYFADSGATNRPLFDNGVNSNTGRLLIRQGNDTGGASNVVNAYVTGTTVSSPTISFNTWTHVAVVRNSGTVTIYINGTGGTGVSASGDLSQTGCLIGAFYDQLTWNFTGYIDDLRITKGYARYTANFTPPTTAFPNN